MPNEMKTGGTCCFCGGPYYGYGNNPEPLASYPLRCCDMCNAVRVIPARLKRLGEDTDSDFSGTGRP